MEDAVVDSATSEATGFPKENIIDNNPDQWWKPTSAATQTIDIDLQEAKTVDYIVLFVHNYKSLATSVTIMAKYSSDDSTYNNAFSSPVSIHSQVKGPIRLKEITETSDPYRYWRFEITIGSTVPEISLLACCQEFDIGQFNEWPENDLDNPHILTIPGGSGYKHHIRKRRNSSKIFIREFLISGNTNYNALRDAWIDSGNGTMPLVYQPGDSYFDAYLVQFDGSPFPKNESNHLIYKPKIVLEQLPFLDDGDSY
jgi:hypothetical protein